MNLYSFFGLEVDLISDFELLEAIEGSSQLAIPEEQSIFAVKTPQSWLSAGQEVRQAFRDEIPRRLSENGAAFLLHLLQEYGDGFSDLMVDADQSEALEEFWQGQWLMELWDHLEIQPVHSRFRQIEGCDPFSFIHFSYDELLELNIPDWEIWLEERRETSDVELPELPTRWLTELLDAMEEAQINAAEQDGRPGLFIYPVIFPDLVNEVEEDEEPFLTIKAAKSWLEAVELGKTPTKRLDPFYEYHLTRYLELKLQKLQLGLKGLKREGGNSSSTGDSRSQAFQENHALPDFLGEPGELILTLWHYFHNQNEE